MDYKNWEEIYFQILTDFNFEIEKDKKSAEKLNILIAKKKQYSINRLKKRLDGNTVVVFGAGPSLEKSIVKYKDEIENMIKIAADGATSALLKNNRLPDVIVTDLDGRVEDQINANQRGSIFVIHAHGNNPEKITKNLPKIKGEIVGTTQCDPKPYKYLYNFGGFTDGDRAIFLAEHFNAKKIYLIGFDFEGRVGKYSFSENIDLKLKKLKLCKYLIEFLNEKNDKIQFL